ncbi:MAG: magnesium transporter CorA family protein [Candidatus Paceibacterota bacterium]|jgi:magnesium transporter
MITSYDMHGTTWVDLEKPSKDELFGLKEAYNIHPIVLNELSEPSLRTKVDLYPNYAYMIFRFPSLLSNGDIHDTEEHEVDFIVGKNFLITAHYESIEPIYTMGKYLETGAMLNKDRQIEHAGFLFYAIMKRLYQASEDDLIHLRHHIKDTEEAIFAGNEQKMVEEISKLNRVLINFWWCTRTHDQLLSSFEIVARNFWGESFHYYLHSLSGEFSKIDKMIDGYKEVVIGLRDTNDSLLTTKTNQTMKVLSMAAATILPISAIASIFGMNVQHMPFVELKYGFWAVILLMVLLSVAGMAYFRFKKWI